MSKSYHVCPAICQFPRAQPSVTQSARWHWGHVSVSPHTASRRNEIYGWAQAAVQGIWEDLMHREWPVREIASGDGAGWELRPFWSYEDIGFILKTAARSSNRLIGPHGWILKATVNLLSCAGVTGMKALQEATEVTGWRFTAYSKGGLFNSWSDSRAQDAREKAKALTVQSMPRKAKWQLEIRRPTTQFPDSSGSLPLWEWATDLLKNLFSIRSIWPAW